MWTKSSFCNTDHVTGNCVDVWRMEAGDVYVRDSKDPDVELHFDAGEWQAFIAGAKAGEFD